MPEIRRLSTFLQNLNKPVDFELRLNLLTLFFFSVWMPCGHQSGKQYHLNSPECAFMIPWGQYKHMKCLVVIRNTFTMSNGNMRKIPILFPFSVILDRIRELKIGPLTTCNENVKFIIKTSFR